DLVVAVSVIERADAALALGTEDLEEDLGDGVGAGLLEVVSGIGEIVDSLLERGDEAGAEVADGGGDIREFVADEGQLDAADRAIKGVLKAAEEEVDTLHAE